MRWVLLTLAAGCTFTPGVAASDARVDVPPDGKPDVPITWTIDGLSGKACPETAAQWSDFIASYNLALAPPTAVWPMQDAMSPLTDSVGTAQLQASGTNAPTFGANVAMWMRHAIATSDSDDASFYNTSDPQLPDVGTSAMTVLVYYANERTPVATRSILFAGAGIPSMIAQVDIDPANHFMLTVGSGVATGSIDHGTNPIPLVLKVDNDHMEQHLIVDKEVIAPTYTKLMSSHGILLAGANNRAPDGRWLYMAAWYGPAAEMTDAQIGSLLTALGW